MRIPLSIHDPAFGELDILVTANPAAPVSELLVALSEALMTAPTAEQARRGWPTSAQPTVGDLGLQPGCRLSTDGQSVTVTEPASASPRSGGIELALTAGPSSGTVFPLPRGRTVLGRSGTAEIVVDDPELSREHLELVLGHSGIELADLASTNGTYLNGVPLRGRTSTASGRSIRAGRHVFDIRAVAGPTNEPQNPGPDGTVMIPAGGAAPTRATTAPAPSSATADRADELIVSEPKPRLGLLAAALPAAGGLALAVYMKNPQFLAFSLLSPVTVLASGLADRWGWRRKQRVLAKESRERAELQVRARVEEQRTIERQVRLRSPDAVAVARIAADRSDRLWERAQGDPEFLHVRVGVANAGTGQLASGSAGQSESVRGVVEGNMMPAPIRDTDGAVSPISDIPVCVDLAARPLIFTGPRPDSRRTAAWIVSQVLVLHAPSRVRVWLVLGADGPDEILPATDAWRWLRWSEGLDHTASTEDTAEEALQRAARVMDERANLSAPAHNGVWAGTWIVLVVDSEPTLARSAILHRVIREGNRYGITVIVLDGPARGQLAGQDPDQTWLGTAVPTPTAAPVAELAPFAGKPGWWRLLNGTGSAMAVLVPDGVDERWCEALGRSLAPLRELAAGQSPDGEAESVRLLDLWPDSSGEPERVADRWRLAPDWRIPIGRDPEGHSSMFDLRQDGPHLLVAGTTGSGKSELLKTIVASLALAAAPSDLGLILIDYKGGAAFAECARLPQVCGVVTDLDGHLTQRALRCLSAELRRREKLFALAGVAEFDQYRGEQSAPGLQRLVIVVDEFAALNQELPEFITGLVGIAQRGRSLGVHLILATQRPAGVVSADIKANVSARICLRVNDIAESLDVIGSPDATAISQATPGRALLRSSGSSGGLRPFQTALTSRLAHVDKVSVEVMDTWHRSRSDRAASERLSDLEKLAETLSKAAAVHGEPVQATPWLPPLPDRLEGTDLQLGTPAPAGTVPIGLVDVPDEQTQQPFTIDAAAGGSIAFIGSARSGRTSALLSIAAGVLRQPSARGAHLYIVDCGQGGLRPLSEHGRCGAYLTDADLPEVSLLLDRLAALFRARRASDLPAPPVLVLVDGWEQLATASDEFNAGRTMEQLLSLLRDSRSAGVLMAVSGDRTLLGLRASAVMTDRLLLRLNDRNDYLMTGLQARDLPATFPPGRAVLAQCGREVQLVLPPADSDTFWPTNDQPGRDGRSLRANDPDKDGSPADEGPPLIRIVALPQAVVGHPPPPASPSRVTFAVGGDQALPIELDLSGPGRHLLICGPPGSGRSTALETILHQSRSYSSVVALISTAASYIDPSLTPGIEILDPRSPDVATRLARLTQGQRAVIGVDNVDDLDDPALEDALVGGLARDGVTVLASCRTESAHVAYGGLLLALRRRRRGLVLRPEINDGALFGASPAPRQAAGRAGRGLVYGVGGYPSGCPVQVIQLPCAGGRQ
ncbi:FtsK/SpoIIIE domain-containing protein [Jatrophihabitans telluris]|uniref:FtsK/SpoIIIE domain-containing protein n=1 Tax=Jatrophihabitans telluris TaxID=2038343 RepID=A0ABY4R2Q6_9ACTN|nr:FtsK/SpoIIIE domain-containing protein [Jatrophihabitans telluris]UQX89698.1 FtsK/SpoIIIE domain-containing protein [Jatrophihabitans telluris]